MNGQNNITLKIVFYVASVAFVLLVGIREMNGQPSTIKSGFPCPQSRLMVLALTGRDGKTTGELFYLSSVQMA